MSGVPGANTIINMLKDEAASIESALLGSKQLQAFSVGALGNYPYYWQSSRNLAYNALTYGWVKSSLKAGADPIEQDGIFTNLYIDTISKVRYTLSSTDQAALNNATAAASQQQTAVLTAWQNAMGSLPPPSPTEQPIDTIGRIIATTWATPATTIQDIQRSTNVNRLLNSAPLSGQTIIPVFVNYLNALGASVSLSNAQIMSNAYLDAALYAAQTPQAAVPTQGVAGNGGITLSDGTVAPDYPIATALSATMNDLKNANTKIDLSMEISRTTQSEYTVKANGGGGFTIPVLDLFGISVGGNASYFSDNIATTSNTTTVQMTFPGVTMVNFGPAQYDQSTGQDWLFIKPITDAIKNGSQDISGYKFSPDPQMDFSKSGPFAFIDTVVFSDYPSAKIVVKSSDYQKIQTTFEQTASVGVSFLGISLGIGGSESTYSNNVTVDASTQTVTIELLPPLNLVAGAVDNAVGWVLGVVPNYPAA